MSILSEQDIIDQISPRLSCVKVINSIPVWLKLANDWMRSRDRERTDEFSFVHLHMMAECCLSKISAFPGHRIRIIVCEDDAHVHYEIISSSFTIPFDFEPNLVPIELHQNLSEAIKIWPNIEIVQYRSDKKLCINKSLQHWCV